MEVLDEDRGCDNENIVAPEVGGKRCRRFDGNDVTRNEKRVAGAMDDVTRNEKIVAGAMGEGVIGEYV